MRRSNHALRRVRERYGLKMTSKELDELSSTISKGNAPLLDKKGPTRVYAVSFKGTILAAVYDQKAKRILTFYRRAKYMDRIKNLGFVTKVCVYMLCRRCESIVQYTISGKLVAFGRESDGVAPSKGKAGGDCYACGGKLRITDVKTIL